MKKRFITEASTNEKEREREGRRMLKKARKGKKRTFSNTTGRGW
jgi:hypothetical protein